MQYQDIKIKEGINLHIINTEKFKTNLISVILTTKINRENVTKNALIPAILKRGSFNMPTQEEINKTLEEMYGASFDCGVDKTGDNQVLKFYIESINDRFLPDKNENILNNSIQKILEIVFNPYLENGAFKKEYVEQEKNNLKQIIEAKRDNKARYALERCIEEMYKNKPFGIYKYGYVEDLNKIDEKQLYSEYQKIINECKIDIFVSGIIDDTIQNNIKQNEIIKNITKRKPIYNIPELEINEKHEEKITSESMEVAQGKLIIGLDIDIEKEEQKYAVMVYNNILGGSANSKLFQNVREKESLAYTASSSYLKVKNNIFINCGIDISNYDKALEIIKKQLEDLKNSKFSEEELDNAKKGIISSIKSINDEQDTEVIYYFSQNLLNKKIDLEQYMKDIEKIKKEDVENIAKKVTINTIYFLKN